MSVLTMGHVPLDIVWTNLKQKLTSHRVVECFADKNCQGLLEPENELESTGPVRQKECRLLLGSRHQQAVSTQT